MRAAIIAAILASAAPAFAQSPPCEVRFVRAPDDVRHVIETWLAAEPRCTSAIDLRVIPTDSGYYLIAQRPDGRIHERFVPDAQAAGVLVASWVADDWVAPKTDVWSSPRPPNAQPVLVPPAQVLPAVTAVSTPRPRRGGPRWITVAAMFSTGDDDDGGFRTELDVMSKGNFLLGVALGWTETAMPLHSPSGPGYMRSADYAATVYGAYTLRTDRWELRGALGFGAVYSEIDGAIDPGPGQPWPENPYIHGSGGGIAATGSLLLTRRLGDKLGIQAGLAGHVISSEFPTDSGMQVIREDAHLFFTTGLRLRI